MGKEIEVDFYLKVGVPDDDDPAKVLDWWRAKSAIFTRLAKLARRVLAESWPYQGRARRAKEPSAVLV